MLLKSNDVFILLLDIIAEKRVNILPKVNYIVGKSIIAITNIKKI